VPDNVFECRHTRSFSTLENWKGYGGGTFGEVWIEGDDGQLQPIFEPGLGLAINSPVLLAGRLWFISERDGVGNVWSVPSKGAPHAEEDTAGLRQETWYEKDAFPARALSSSDQRRLVYTSGGLLYCLDVDPDSGVASGGKESLSLRCNGPGVMLRKRHLDASEHLREAKLNIPNT